MHPSCLTSFVLSIFNWPCQLWGAITFERDISLCWNFQDNLISYILFIWKVSSKSEMGMSKPLKFWSIWHGMTQKGTMKELSTNHSLMIDLHVFQLSNAIKKIHQSMLYQWYTHFGETFLQLLLLKVWEMFLFRQSKKVCSILEKRRPNRCYGRASKTGNVGTRFFMQLIRCLCTWSCTHIFFTSNSHSYTSVLQRVPCLAPTTNIR